MGWRRGRWERLCARVASPAWVPGPSTSPLGALLDRLSPLLVLCLLCTACDGGFAVSGRLVSNSEAAPRDCTISLKGPPQALMCCDAPISPKGFRTQFTVAPTKIDYTLVIACSGFRPHERRFTYGVDVSPSKPLELGVVVLEAQAQ